MASDADGASSVHNCARALHRESEGARQFIFRALMRFQSRDEITFYDFGPWDEIMVKSDRMNSSLVCEIMHCMNSA